MVRNISMYVRRAATNKTLVLAAFLLTVFGASAIGVTQYAQESQAQAFARDCDDNAIVRCGVANYSELTAAYDANQNGDVRAIYDHYWIQRVPAVGDQVLDGLAMPDGTVVVNGRVVAKNAASVGRQAIMHSQPISIAGKTYYQTSHVGGLAFKNPNTSLETLVVLDAQGNFKYAVVKACGNPIYATPVPPPAPEPTPKPEPRPEPKMIEVCDTQTMKIVTINEADFTAERYSKNLADCTPKPTYINVCNINTFEIVTIDEKDFDVSKHSKDIEDCTLPPVEMVRVCDIKTKTIVTVSKDLAANERYSKNLDDCKEKCTLPGKETINKDDKRCTPCQYNTTIAADDKNCVAPALTPTPQPTPTSKPTPAPVVKPAVVTPAVLPTTGPMDIFGSTLGIVSMTLAAYYYALSRRP